MSKPVNVLWGYQSKLYYFRLSWQDGLIFPQSDLRVRASSPVLSFGEFMASLFLSVSHQKLPGLDCASQIQVLKSHSQ